jgi:hypothetical protein
MEATTEQQLTAVGLDWKIWKEGAQFSKGHLATYRGSLWISQVDNPTSKPGSSDEWKLTVKSGSVSQAKDTKDEEVMKLLQRDADVLAAATGWPRAHALRAALDMAKQNGTVGDLEIEPSFMQSKLYKGLRTA